MANDAQLKIDCSTVPSENNCQLVIMAPEGQRDDLIEAAAAHSVRSHGHEDTDELRENLEQAIESKEPAPSVI